MGNLVAVEFMSLDGVMQSVLSADEDREGGFDQGGWVLPYVDEVVETFMSSATAGASAMLVGRKTYEIFAATWPHADPADPAVAAMNAMPKYVVSRTLGDDLGWANSLRLGPDLSAEVARIKSATEGDIVVLGSGELLRALVALDAVDEYRLLVFPLVLGRGKRLFDEETVPSRLSLVDTKTSTSGVLIATYRPVPPQ
ncbi:dihydrofolate reductase family protein [Streptomyces sp. NPDC004609]|uniref:dihydrofolate reductase family protein n=1 Tax=Streptomyces sp. NPDC004609 TaxID=3364704 RepID=UPI0036C70F18